MNDWVIVTSRSGYHSEYGYPIAETLCKTKEEAVEYINESHIDDPIITPFVEYRQKLNLRLHEEMRNELINRIENK